MAARWRIVNDVPQEDFGLDGRFTPVREITFEELSTGRTGSVKVPTRLYTMEAVAAAIQPYADTIESIGERFKG